VRRLRDSSGAPFAALAIARDRGQQAQEIVTLDPFQHGLSVGQHDLAKERAFEREYTALSRGDLNFDPVAYYRVDGDLALL